jgi:hypothetical protein
MKKDISKTKLTKAKKSNKKKAIEEIEPEQEEIKQNFTPEIEDIEEEKQIINSDVIPEGIINSDFQEEFPSLTSKARVSLDRINLQSRNTFNLEEFLETSPLNKIQKQSWQENFDPNSYISGIKNSDEPKYINNYEGSFNPIEKVNMKSLSALNEQKGKFQFNPMIKQEEKSIETYVPAEKIKMEGLGKNKNNIVNPSIVDSSKAIKYTPGKY